MSLSKRLAGAGTKRSANNQYIEPLIPGRPAFATNAGVVVDGETAIRMSAVYSCVRLLSDTVSSLPVGAYLMQLFMAISLPGLQNQTLKLRG